MASMAAGTTRPPMSSPADQQIVTVALGRFDPLIERGVEATLAEDPGLRIIQRGIPACDQGASTTSDRCEEPDVALVDEALGCVELERLCAGGSSTRFVVFAREPSMAYGGLLIASGFSCFGSGVVPVELRTTVRASYSGRRVFMPSDGDPVEWQKDDRLLLRKREREVLHCLIRNLSYAQIAATLSISPPTVASHATP